MRGDGLIETAWLERFAALLPPRATALDLGCGPGVPIARRLAGRGLRVTGVDAAPVMIGLARAALPAQAWHVAEMRGLDRGRRFAGSLAWDSFVHLDAADQRAMFAVVAAHALPGAGLMVTTGPAAGTAIGELFGAPLFCARLAGSEHAMLLACYGFTIVAQENEDPGCGGRAVWLARRDRQARPPSP